MKKTLLILVLAVCLLLPLAGCACKHENTHIENAKEATCTEDGYTGDTVCDDCGETVGAGTVIEAAGHRTQVVNSSEAGCNRDGYTGDTVCLVCGKTVEVGTVIVSTGEHAVTEIRDAVDPTCTSEGYTGDTYCTDCGLLLAEGSVIPRTEHNAVLRDAREADCTNAGFTGNTVCADCGVLIAEGTPIEATGHRQTEVRNEKTATCSAEGYTGDTYCKDCGTLIKTGRSVAKAAHGQTEVRNAKTATCSAEGYTGDTYCKDCGTLIKTGKTVAKTAHGQTEVRNAKTATCSAEGYTGDTYCKDCGTLIKTGKTVAKAAHGQTVLKNAKAATCSAVGYTGDTYCKDCGTLIKTGKTVAKAAHGQTVLKNAKAATCTAAGYTGDSVCSVCGQTVEKGTVVKATGHLHTKTVGAVAATDTENGYSGDTVCTDCTATVSKGSVIRATYADLIEKVTKILSSELKNAGGDYEKIPPLTLSTDTEKGYITAAWQGYRGTSPLTWNTFADGKKCTYTVGTGKWTVTAQDAGNAALLTARNDRLSYLRAEHAVSEKAALITDPAFTQTACVHDGMKTSTEDGHACFVCTDCGLWGVDLKTDIVKNPSTSATGVMHYAFRTDGADGEFTRVIPKVPTYDWFWAFCNDKNGDGMPEFDSYQYIDETTVRYQYLYKASDFADYPKTTDFGGVSDDEWNSLYEDWDKEYNALYLELIRYTEGSDEYKKIAKQIDDVDTKYYELEEKLIERDDEAYARYLEGVKEYEARTGNRVNDINPAKTKTVTEEQKLYYFLHVPFDYDPDKSYPVLVFYPGSGGVLYSFYGSSVKSDKTLEEGDFYYGKFRQLRAMNETSPYANYSCSAMDSEGNWLPGQLTIRDAGWCGSFFSQWYSRVKAPGEGRDKYDCFILFIQPSDSYWWSAGSYLSMTNQVNVPEIEGAIRITPEMTGDASYKGYSRPTYDSNYVSASPDGQLVCKLIDNMAKTYSIDLKRQYVAGGSLGGAFTMDMINHYHDRFACAVPVVAATADITERTAEAIVKSGLNVWAISGDGDTNCNKYFSKLFVQGLNKAKEKLKLIDPYTYQFSFFAGGHSCAYIGGTLRTASQGVSITYSDQVLDFMFNSKKQ